MKTLRQNVAGEWSFTSGGSYADPVGEVEVTVVFRREDGSGEWRVPAFWAGGQEWRVRFASGVPGVYRFRSECSGPSDSGLHGRTGSCRVVEYEGGNPLYRHGGVHVAADRRHFAHADGTPFLWVGDTWWMGLCSRLPWPQGFRTLTADRVAKGFTVVQIVAGLYPDMPAFDPRGANEAGFPWTEGFGQINPAYFDAADRRLRHLVEAGLVPCIVGCWGYYLPWLGMEKMRRHWRYLVARYGAWPVVWCLAGEGTMPYYLSADPAADARLQKTGWTELAACVRSLDAFARPITIHPSCSARQCVTDVGVLDFDMLQTGHGDRGSLPNTVKQVSVSYRATPVMPVVLGEVCYEGIGGCCGPELQRWLFWACMLGGAAGFTYGANGIWQVNTRPQPYGPSPHGMTWGNTPWEEAHRRPGSAQVGLGGRLLSRLPWWEIEPHPEWVEPGWNGSLDEQPFTCGRHDVPLAAGIPGRLRIIYCPLGTGLRRVKGIEAGVRYRVYLFDPLTGAVTAGGVAVADADGAWTPAMPGLPAWFPRPIYQDWVLVLTADGVEL
ncbi:MAG: putative endoglucanase [Lentisphaerae bacterium ADurb.BinA184]|nr:MAG: putative endoglucanase [Lentisphaerae bacterium ADurb.BinA184]